MGAELPKVEHVYLNHLLDSTRWDHVEARDGDIIIATPYKSGTTWMQNIVLHLIFQDLQPRLINDYSPWVDIRPRPLDQMIATLAGQTHRRCIKTHLPLDGLPYRANAQYIVVGRDPRDVFMSMWNHYSAYTPAFYKRVNGPGLPGKPLPECPADIREFWAMWINRGWFEWEAEGYPHWSNFRHVQTWWNFRHLPNIRFVHFADLLDDLPGEIARIADWLGIACPPDTLAAIADKLTFASMKREAEILVPSAHESFQGGAKRFFNKGTNGRWRTVLTDADLEMYEATAARELSPDCRAWLENGT